MGSDEHQGALLHRGHVHSLYRWTRRDGTPLVTKVLDAERRTDAAAARLRREFAILRELAALPGVVDALELREEEGDLCLDLRDTGGTNLASYLDEASLSLAERLALAVQVAEILGRVHVAGIVHRDVKPRNILVGADREVSLIDFGIASHGAHDSRADAGGEDDNAPASLHGTLSYIAPEQTGRLRTPVDHRADLYSLGVTLYQLFTGQLPFTADDPAELVHAHLARLPTPPDALAPALPSALSQALLKLLAKAPDDRYRSAFGLAHDLSAIHRAVLSGESSSVVLGAYDPPLLFHIPDHLYGREEALATLSGAYTRASSGSPELVVLRGTSGSGKSALFRALRRQHLGEGARFADGAYDPGRLHIPYSALFDALSKPLVELLQASDDVRARVRWGLHKALGGLASALTPRLPALTELLGSVDAMPGEERLTVDATRNRLHRALHILVRALAGPRTPLVLFLDDVQWIDQASLQLIADLIDETASDGLFCVFAYDDDDDAPAITVGADAVVTSAAIEATLLRLSSRARVSSVELRPLSVAAISAMIADTLALPEERVQDLAAVIVDKSGGSGFFAAELLTELHALGAIRFDAGRGAWTYELAAASSLSVTANVVDLLLGRARTLDPSALALLQRGACLGMSFTVAEIGPERAPADDRALSDGDGDDGRALEVLGGACTTGLVSAVPGGFAFPHERVREAIAATLDASERAAIHLALGRRTLAEAEAVEAVDDLVFKTAEQIIAAGSLITEVEERRRGARLCLAAARRARAGAAFRSTISFCRAGAALLGEPSWSAEYTLLFPLLALENECALAIGDLKAAEETTEVLLRNACCDEDRAEILLTRGGILLSENRLDEVVDIAAEVARLLGAQLPRRPSTASLVLGMIRAKRAVGRRTPAELLELPPLVERRDRLLMNAYSLASASAFQSDPRLLIQIAAKMITHTLHRGLDASAAPAFILYGIAAGSPSGDTALMDAYGRAALDLLERFPDRSVEPMVRFLYGGIVQSMAHPYRACIANLREATRIGVESGGLAAAGLAAMAAASLAVVAGLDLDRVRVEAEAALALAKAAKIGSSEWVIRVDLGFARALLGSGDGPRFSGPDLDEATLDAREDPSIAPSTFYAYLHRRLLYHVILCEDDEAREVIRRADPGVKEIFRFFHSYVDYRLLRALTLAMSPETDGTRRTIRELERTLREVRRAAANNPANFGALYELVTAELRRLRGKADTPEAFERALASASKEQNPLHEALVAERAGRYYLGRGLHDSAKAYLRRARRAYGRWRAKEKVIRLDREFPGLDRRAPTVMPATMADVSITLTADPSSSSASSTSGGSSASGHVVDLASIIKAAQVFAAEIDLDVLSERMLRLVVENAGAERGVLLLVEEGAVVAVTEYSARGDRIIDHGRAPVETVASIPHALVLRAHRRGSAEVFEDAASDPVNAADSYVQRLKLRSALGLPLVARGRGIGVVYLENNLATGVFTEERLDILQVLAVQAAVALDHADFFRRIDAARDAAESASLAKSRFLANMSHELRTPLNAILGYAELIADEAEDAGVGQISDDIGRIRQAGAHLLALVSEILDLTKVESGEHDLERTPIVLEELLDGTCELLRSELQSGGNTLIRDDGDELGVFVGDPIRLRQILVNLLSNASKFTDHGTITLRTRQREDGVDFAVIDTGIGLGEDQLTCIFEPFVQVDETSTRRYGGVGLGLTICRGLAEQMGGTLTVRSEIGVGSTFTLRLPLARS